MTASAAAFRDYHVYGIAIRSELPLTFRESPAARGADVTFALASRRSFDEAAAAAPPVAMPDEWYERRRCPDGSEFLRFPDAFEFLVSPDGRHVACGLLARATAASFETYLLGHVLSYALLKQGFEPLHATTIAMDGGAVALLGASGQGKSTLAAALLARGHQLLTDDLLMIRDVDGVPCACPGPPRIKLFPAVARRFLDAPAWSAPMNHGAEKLVVPLEPHQTRTAPAPIRAFVVLEDDPGDAAVRMTACSRRDALIELVGSTFNARLIGPERVRRQFEAARAWAARIPVRRLSYPRAFDRLDAVCDVVAGAAARSA